MKTLKTEEIKKHAYYHTGGECAFFFMPETTEELSHLVKELAQKKISFFYLGGGTNSLISDEFWDGAVISFELMKHCEFSNTRAVVGAGVENTEFARMALDRSLSGVAWMNRLPGQIGGTVRMNARCYGGEVSEIVKKITSVTRTGKMKTYVRSDEVFRGYKDTIFMENGEAISEVEIELAHGDGSEIAKKMEFCETDRVSKGQFKFPTCGCIFKNNYRVGLPAGMLLDAAGVKALKSPGISINPHHANFVYNESGNARLILELSFQMRELVYREFGVWLEYEMEVLGRFPDDLLSLMKLKKPSIFNEEKLKPLRAKFARRI